MLSCILWTSRHVNYLDVFAYSMLSLSRPGLKGTYPCDNLFTNVQRFDAIGYAPTEVLFKESYNQYFLELLFNNELAILKRIGGNKRIRLIRDVRTDLLQRYHPNPQVLTKHDMLDYMSVIEKLTMMDVAILVFLCGQTTKITMETLPNVIVRSSTSDIFDAFVEAFDEGKLKCDVKRYLVKHIHKLRTLGLIQVSPKGVMTASEKTKRIYNILNWRMFDVI